MSTLAIPQPTSTTTVDAVQSVAEFKVKHMMISNVKGQFTAVTGVITLDEADVTKSGIEASIEAASVNTRDAQRDAHLKSADFFDVERFPTRSFKSTRVTRSGDGELAVTGDLTIHGVTREVVFAVEGPTPPAQGSQGQYPGGAVGNHENQPQGLRSDLERRVGDRGHPRR